MGEYVQNLMRNWVLYETRFLGARAVLLNYELRTDKNTSAY
jgi:hypothetical protein